MAQICHRGQTKKRGQLSSPSVEAGAPVENVRGLRPRIPRYARDRRRCAATSFGALRAPRRTRHNPLNEKGHLSKVAFFIKLARPERFELPTPWFVER
jgi:hypothetical protein